MITKKPVKTPRQNRSDFLKPNLLAFAIARILLGPGVKETTKI